MVYILKTHRVERVKTDRQVRNIPCLGRQRSHREDQPNSSTCIAHCATQCWNRPEGRQSGGSEGTGKGGGGGCREVFNHAKQRSTNDLGRLSHLSACPICLVLRSKLSPRSMVACCQSQFTIQKRYVGVTVKLTNKRKP